MKKRVLSRTLAVFTLLLVVVVLLISVDIPGLVSDKDISASEGSGAQGDSGGQQSSSSAMPSNDPSGSLIPDGVEATQPGPEVENSPGITDDTDDPDGSSDPRDYGPDTDEQEVEEPGLPAFEPYAVEETQPVRMIASTAIMADGALISEYTFPEIIDFGYGEDYTELEGIVTFRGNNFRDSAAFGFADIRNAKFGEKWSYKTSSYTAPDEARWSGNGWTGQPLIVKWPEQTRRMMNMYDWAKAQSGLVEVIYATMDGYVYFTELESGKATRDKLYLGFPFKGSGALDPRGYPLLYVGAGYQGASGSMRILIVSLVDGSVLYTFGNGDSFSPRAWDAADGSPLVDAATDNLIYPSENGVVYIIKLNSEFDPEAGVMSITPSAPVKWRFKGKRSHVDGKYWLGVESSPVLWRGHLIICDNGGHLVCLDINNLEIDWVQDVLDDTNCTPVLELEDGHPYIYLSTSFHGGWRAPGNGKAPVPLWKIDAVTGEYVWHTDYDCYTLSGVSGGVQGTAAVGAHELSGLVYFPVAMTPSRGAGVLAALDKHTGEVVWEFQTRDYAWSSPVCVYDQNGKGYIIYCTSGGYMYLLDGLTGDKLDSVLLGGTIEASPAVYNSTVVIGTRDMKTWGVKLT